MAKKKEVVEETPVDYSQFRRVQREEKAAKSTSVIDKIKELPRKTLALIAIAIILVIGGGIALSNSSKKSDTSYTSTLTDGKATIATGDVTVTKQGFYEYLLKSRGADEVLAQAYNAIADAEITDKDDIEKAVKEIEDDIKSYMGSLKAYASAMGYKSTKDLKKNYTLPQAKITLLQKKYLTDNFDTVCSTYKVAYVKQVTYEKESQAVKAIKKATSKKEFNAIYKKNSGSDLGMITTKTTSLDENISALLGDLSAVEKDGIYAEAVKTSDDKYAILYVYNTNKKKYKKEIIESLGNTSDIQDDIEAAYLKQYKFTVNDLKIKEEIKADHESFIN